MTEKGDLISREALKNAILEHRDDYIKDNFFWSKLFDIIDNAPTVEQKYYERVIAQINPVIEARPQGEWLEYKEDNEIRYYCSNCHVTKGQAVNNFCACCGADMRGDYVKSR